MFLADIPKNIQGLKSTYFKTNFLTGCCVTCSKLSGSCKLIEFQSLVYSSLCIVLLTNDSIFISCLDWTNENICFHISGGRVATSRTDDDNDARSIL